MKRVIALGTASAALAGGAVMGTVGSASAAAPQQAQVAQVTRSAVQQSTYRPHEQYRHNCRYVHGYWTRYWHRGHWNWRYHFWQGGRWMWVWHPGHRVCFYR